MSRTPFDILEDYERRALAHVVEVQVARALDSSQWRGVGYRIGSRRLVSGFGEVVEIVPLPPLTAVPGAQPWLLGVGNLRGNLFPVIDLKQFLEGERTVLRDGQRVIVMRQPGGDVALTIDELYGQRGFDETQAVEPGSLASGHYAHFIQRAYRSDGQEWGVFALSRLARTPEFRQAAL